jgi:hypothetical protein
MDPISVVVTAAVFTAGWLLGRHARLKARPKQPKPWCLCEHHYGAHDPETGQCQEKSMERVNHVDTWVACPCVRYVGPQPVEQYWVPPAADMNIVTAPRPIERGE